MLVEGAIYHHAVPAKKGIIEVDGGEEELTYASTARSDSDTNSGASSAMCTGRNADDSESISPHSAEGSSSPARGDERGDGDFSGGGSSSDDAAPMRPSALTPAVLNLLIPKEALGMPPLLPDSGAPVGLSSSPAGIAAIDELSADLHLSARQGPQAPRNVLHALSKESLDVLRAERIARRMERAEEEGRRPHSPLIPTPVNDVSFNVDGNGSPSKKGHKLKSARASRVYMPIVASSSSQTRRGEPTLRAICEPAPPVLGLGLD